MARKKDLMQQLRQIFKRNFRAFQKFVSKRNIAALMVVGMAMALSYQNCSNSNFSSDSSDSSAGVLNTGLVANGITLGATVGVTLAIPESTILADNTAPSGTTLSFVGMGTPSNGGQLSQSGTTFNFISNTVGNSSFSYTIADSNGDQATGTITVQVLPSGAATGYFYASNYQGNLFVLDPNSGSLQSTVSTTYKSQSIGFNDLAIDSSAVLYGKDADNNIYKVNLTSGAATLYISSLIKTPDLAVGLTFLANGNIATVHATSTGYSVVSINPSTLAVTTLVPESKGYSMTIGKNVEGDLKALPDGYLYWTVTNSSSTLCKNYSGQGNQTIVRIDPSSGATKEIACATLPDIAGLGYAQKALYAFSGPGDLIQINLSTGAFTLINATGQSFVGATSNPALW